MNQERNVDETLAETSAALQKQEKQATPRQDTKVKKNCNKLGERKLIKTLTLTSIVVYILKKKKKGNLFDRTDFSSLSIAYPTFDED